MTDVPRIPKEPKCFRPRRYYLVVGAVSAVFFGVMGVTSTIAAYFNIDGSFPQPRLSALIFGGFWLAFTLMAAWVIAAYFRERLFLAHNTIFQQGIFRATTLDAGEVVRIKWRTLPAGGSVVVRTGSEKITMHLHNFTPDEREEIARFVRKRFAEEIQENWSRFEEVFRRTSLHFSPGLGS